MASLIEIMQLCRLCLVKDQVNIPIFEEQGDIRQIFLKISACLPVKVSREDNLPKKICDTCSSKLESLYQFWNTSANSEKQLLKWLSQVGVEKTSGRVTQSHSINSDGVVLKQEVVELADTHSVDDDLAADDLNISNDAHDYILQQQQLPYQPLGFQFQQDGFTEGEGTSSTSGPSATVTSEAADAPKRKRRAAAMKALPPHIDSEEEDEDDVDMVETKIAKTEEQTDESGAEDPEPTAFVGVPSTSADNEQPGPSGVGKGAAEATLIDVQGKFLLITESDAEAIIVPQISVLGMDSLNVMEMIPEPTNEFQASSQKFRLLKPKPLLESKPSQIAKLSKPKPPPKKRHLCEICGKGFASTTKLSYHSAVHSDERPYSCPLCSKTFKFLSRVRNHMTVHINQSTDKEVTDTVMTSNTSIVAMPKPNVAIATKSTDEANQNFKENETVNKNEEYECKICLKSFKYANLLKNHMLRHGGENEKEILVKVFTCTLCKKCFPTKAKLTIHTATHSEERPFRCNVCSKSFKQVELLKGHMKLHLTAAKYKCQYCEKTCRVKKGLIEHESIHTGVKLFICDICGKQFRALSALETHISAMHKKKFSCKKCSVTFKSRQGYQSHLENHAGVKKPRIHVCSICQRSFKFNYQLQDHMVSHDSSNSLKLICDICGKIISTKHSMRKHKLVHLGVRPYKCNQCEKSFARKAQLQIHTRVHTGEKPYTCHLCNKSFTQRTTLVIHMRFHTGERPYSCNICQKGFVSRSLMNIHKRSKH